MLLGVLVDLRVKTAVRYAEQEVGGEAVDRAEDLSAMSEAEEGEMDWVRPWQ